MTRTEASEHVKKVASQLGEHFDAVQISVSMQSEGSTFSFHRGSGNYYARKGLAQEFLAIEGFKDAATEIAIQLKGE